MQHIIFRNPGELEIRAVKIMGVHVKETENPIGYFGTGLKYTIAILLRLDQRIKIHIGTTVYSFSLVETIIRGKPFDLIKLHNETTGETEELGFTTDLGKTWDLWMAYRELYSNAKDEAGSIQLSSTLPTPTEGETQIIVTGDGFCEVHAMRKKFILETEAKIVTDHVTIHEGATSSIFYRGMKVSSLRANKPAKFTYNITRSVSLTEDRTAKYSFECPDAIAKSILAVHDKSFLREVLQAEEYYYESEIDFDFSQSKASDEFLEVVERSITLGQDINPSAKSLYKRMTEDAATPKLKTLSIIDKKMLTRAIDFCQEIEFPVDDYEIRVVEKLGTMILGRADPDTDGEGLGIIYISAECLNLGTKMLAGTLIEEFIHLRFGYYDMTRSMQNHLFNTIVGLGERLRGEPL